jgi:hypothetical protein
VKALHGMLPTATRLLAIYPCVYPDDLCPRCLQVAELPTHLWRCPCSSEAVSNIVTGGTALFWKQARAHKCQPASVGSDIFPGPHTVFEALQGLVPLEWTTILQQCGVSARGTHSIVLEVGRFFVSMGYKVIWKAWCEAQVACEHQYMITQQIKMRRQEGGLRVQRRKQGRAKATYLVHARTGACPNCQLSLATHNGGVCPPLVDQAPKIADSLLHSHCKSVCILPSVYNPRKKLKVLDSAGVGTED